MADASEYSDRTGVPRGYPSLVSDDRDPFLEGGLVMPRTPASLMEAALDRNHPQQAEARRILVEKYRLTWWAHLGDAVVWDGRR